MHRRLFVHTVLVGTLTVSLLALVYTPVVLAWSNRTTEIDSAGKYQLTIVRFNQAMHSFPRFYGYLLSLHARAHGLETFFGPTSFNGTHEVAMFMASPEGIRE